MLAARRVDLPLAMSLPLAFEIVGGDLGRASKMPCATWGISADECKRGGELKSIEGTPCAVCYAATDRVPGHYGAPTVVKAHQKRLAGIAHPRWSEAMAFLIRIHGHRYFRWFDSGDIQSFEHLSKICDVCMKTRHVSHWLPTHEHELVREYMAGRRVPSNLTIRISSDYIGEPAPDVGGLPTSTVHRELGTQVPHPSGRAKDSIECKAYLRANHCGLCRACWDPRVKNVSYHEH